VGNRYPRKQESRVSELADAAFWCSESILVSLESILVSLESISFEMESICADLESISPHTDSIAN